MIIVFTVTPVFLLTTNYNEDDINFVRIPDPDTYSMFCSHISPLTSPVSCKVNSIPKANITVYRERMNGDKFVFLPTFKQDDEVLIALPPLRSNKAILLHCVASNIVSTVAITINLTYTCK